MVSIKPYDIRYGSPDQVANFLAIGALGRGHVAAFGRVCYVGAIPRATPRATSARPFLLFGSAVRNLRRKDLILGYCVQEILVVVWSTAMKLGR